MNYIIYAYAADGSIIELFRTGNKEEAERSFKSIITQHHYHNVLLMKELDRHWEGL